MLYRLPAHNFNMNYQQKLIHGTFIRRYKRFLADVILDDGTQVVAHCTNSGSMKSCLENGFNSTYYLVRLIVPE